MKRIHLPAALLTAALAVCCFALSAAAETVDDVYDALRAIGAGDSFIATVRNQYEQNPHDENGMTINGTYDTYANWAEYIYIYEDDINDYIASRVFTTTTPAVTTAPAGSTETTTVTTAVTEVPFSQLTLEEQKAYVASLSEEERAAFLAALSPADRRSILKQLETDDKAAVLAILTDLGEDLGVYITIDTVKDDGIGYSVRDSSGNLLDSTVLGYQIDSTGWDTTLPVLLSCGAILLALCGIAATALRSRETAEASERHRERRTE